MATVGSLHRNVAALAVWSSLQTPESYYNDEAEESLNSQEADASNPQAHKDQAHEH